MSSVIRSRTIYPYESNLTPSVATDIPANLDPIEIESHAYLRVQLLYTLALSIYKKAVRSDGVTTRGSLKVSRSISQGGSATDENHACHAASISHITDNLKENVINEIHSENQLTPKKQKILQDLGASPRTLTKLPSLTREAVQEKVDTLWGKDYLENLNAHLILQATTALHRMVNLSVDLAIERVVRKVLEPYLQECFEGKLDPKDLTLKAISIIQDTIDQNIHKIDQKIAFLKRVHDSLTKCQKYLQEERPIAFLNEQKKMKLFRFDVKGFFPVTRPFLITKQQLGASHPKMVVKRMWERLSHYKTTYGILAEEIGEKINSLKQLSKVFSLEKEGTQVPPFELITPEGSSYSPLTKRTPPKTDTKQEIEDVKRNLNFMFEDMP